MKKFIQISLVIILMFVLLQFTAAGSVVSANGVATNADTTSISTAADPAVGNGEMAAACLVRVKGVICVRPNVGWNS